ncbi:MAG TPA: hypothetical protein VGH76_10600 [Actinomycetospora sp.]|jgi:hypothetical protein|uniref:hypothetical protein n=1 Tax=Actinomycetospora sp. TaxID=1872135 RepID=UPI002F3F51EA
MLSVHGHRVAERDVLERRVHPQVGEAPQQRRVGDLQLVVAPGLPPALRQGRLGGSQAGQVVGVLVVVGFLGAALVIGFAAAANVG